MLAILRFRRMLCSSLVAVALVAANPMAPPAQAANRSEVKLQRFINSSRAARGLRGLRLVSSLSNIAREHSARMASGRRMYHHDCLSCAIRSYRWRIAGENVGAGRTTAGIHRKMMRSRYHRGNILRRGYRRVGIGVVSSGGLIWVTEIFLG